MPDVDRSGFELSLVPGLAALEEVPHMPQPFIANRTDREDWKERREHEREQTSAFYGPCARCEKHWTRKLSKDEAGICRLCLGRLSRPSSSSSQP
jgi:hypothetical protein